MGRAAGLGVGADEGVDGWALRALESLTSLPGVLRAGLGVVEGGGRRLAFTASDRVGEHDARWCHVDAYDDVPLNTAVRTGDVVLGTLAELADAYPVFVDGQRGGAAAAIAAVPVTGAGQVLGAYVLYLDALPDGTARLVEDLSVRGARLGRTLRLAQRARGRGRGSWAGDTEPGARVVQHEVDGDLADVADARHFLAETLHDWGVAQDRVATAVLCLSELVTNAVVHGSGGCSVRVSDEAGVLTVAVRDAGSPEYVATREPSADPLEVHGRGLKLVAALSSRWGSDLGASGTTVWFVLDP